MVVAPTKRVKGRWSKWTKIIFGLVVAGALFAGLAFWWYGQKSFIIENFNPKRDTKPILEIFDKNWYWLIESTREEYSPEFMLEHRTPDRNPKNFGKMKIKILRDRGKLAGFITYYKLSVFRGKLLFVGVSSQFRGKGYGTKLVNYAVNDMFNNMGCSIVELITRTDNVRSRGLYKKLGFSETPLEKGFVQYTKYKK